jgi:hypothetical protein
MNGFYARFGLSFNEASSLAAKSMKSGFPAIESSSKFKIALLFGRSK